MSIKSWKIITNKTVHQTPWIRVKEDHCQVDSQKLIYTFVQRTDEGPLIIAEENDGKLWMVRQYRHPIKKVIWQFPAEGKLEGETWESAAERGLNEEIGKSAGSLINLGLFYPDPGMLEQKSYFFLATDLADLKTSINDHSEVEDLEVNTFTLKEIEAMVKTGEICDGWTLSGIYLYKKFKNLA